MFRNIVLPSTILLTSLLVSCAPDAPKQTAHFSAKTITMPAPDYANAPLDLSTPEAAAYAMMIAMYQGEAARIDQIFLSGAALKRVNIDGKVMGNGLERWRDWVSTLELGQAYEEIFAVEVQEFGNLASVWAPFIITFNGEIAGCGINQLSMARNDGSWRVVSGMDIPAPKDSCDSFKADYLAGL